MIRTSRRLKKWFLKLLKGDNTDAETKKLKEIKKRKAKWWLIGPVLLILYLFAALYPYIFVPECSNPAEIEELLKPINHIGDRVAILMTGEEAFDARIRMIANTKRTINCSNLFMEDDSGCLIVSALMAAADRGVQVRILTDGLMGAIKLWRSKLGYVLGSYRNMELRYYNPVNWLAPSGINARNHEKYIIADEQTMILGGRNISDKFLTERGHPDYNDDLDVLVFSQTNNENNPIHIMSRHFESMWKEYCKPAFSFVPENKTIEVDGLENKLRRRHTLLCLQRPELIEPADWISQTVPIDGIAILTNPINTGVKEPVLWTALIGLMKHAKERIWLQTPYLILNNQMQRDIAAVVALPQELVVIINSCASGDNLIASADYLIQKQRLKKMNISLFELQGDTSVHTKALLIDNNISVIGSFNIDIRSAYINTEVMLVIYSEEISNILEQYMRNMFALSIPVHLSAYEEQSIQIAPKPISFMKDLMLYLISPFVWLFRYLV